MKKFLILGVLLLYNIIYSQGAAYVVNAVNTPTSVANPNVLLGALPIPNGTIKPYIKDDIRWETYNINNFSANVINLTSILYKPLTYTPTYGEIITSLGFIPYDNTNPNGYISSYTETDPIWTGVSGLYKTKNQNDLLYKDISYVPSWIDIISKPTTIGGFGITDFNSLGDARWSLLGHTHTFVSLTSKPTTLGGYGIIDAYPLTGNPSFYINQAGARTAISLTTTGTGVASYNNSTGVLNIPIPTVGTVTSVGITGSDFSISGSPITSNGNIALALSTTGVSAGTYGRVIVDTKGRVTAGKRQETYSGITDASGNYTVVFETAYGATPNIQVCLINPNVRDTPIPVINNTGFTVNVQRRVDVIGLLPSYGNVVGSAVHVLITEN